MARYFTLSFFFLCLLTANCQKYERIDSLQLELLKVTKDEVKVDILLKLSREFEYIYNDSSLNYARTAYSIAKKDNFSKGVVNALVQQGRMLIQKNDYVKAMESLEMAVELGEQQKMVNEVAIANGAIGIIYAEFGDFDNSAKFNFSALKLFEKAGNKMEIGITLGNIAADMLSQKNYKKALDYMHEALVIAKEINDKPGIAQQYNNIGGLYFTSYKDYARALSYYTKSLSVNRELKDKQQQGINLLNIGYCYFRLNIADSALYFFEKAHEIFNESENPIRMANGEIALGKYYQKISEFDRSLEHSLKALNLGTKNNSKELISEASDIIYNIYLTKGDTINAFKYSMINSQARDSLQLMQSQKMLYKLEFQYNYEKKDKERKLRQQRSNYIIGIIFLGLLSGIVIIFLIYSRQRIKVRNADLEKQKISDELNFKNKELTINLMALMKKNELLTDISQKLIKIEKEVPKDELYFAINNLNKELKQTSDEKIWKEFALRFNQTNSDFYEKLLKKYPDLTQNELRLCAYLRLNMTSKEISEITGQRILTLEHARYRLRKKLGISGSDNNLTSFLAQI